MDLYRRRAPDYTELAYREAVAKLKYLLAESYTPVSTQHKPVTSLSHADKDIPETSVYPLEYPRTTRFGAEASPFIRRQEEYIDQLEKEGQLYREELSRMLDKIREASDRPHGSEEDEPERELKETHRRGRGPSIVYSSRISELEAQLTQCRLELRKAQDEASYLKAHSKPIQPPVSQQTVQQLESLQRERDDLNDRVASLQTLVGQLRDKEASATQKVKRSLDVVDQAQFDKNQVVHTLEMEVRRLKSELDRMSDKQREALQESARRVSEAERRYAVQIERLNGDLAAQWDAANRLNLELDRARRTEAELRRELAQKAATIEELKKELTTKTGSLQNEALAAAEDRERLEGELSACKLSVERAERQGRQEVARLQAEVQALRTRLDRADQDLLHSRKENIRLADVIAGLEKELSLSKLTKDSAASKELKRADELTSMIKEMDAKHEESVSELEGLIQSQTQLMEKLNAECQALTKRLDESSARHKEEMASLQNNIDYISSKLAAPDHFQNQEWRDEDKLGKYEENALPSNEEKITNKDKEDPKTYSNTVNEGVKEEEKKSYTEDDPKDYKKVTGYEEGKVSDETHKDSVEGYKQGQAYQNENVEYDQQQQQSYDQGADYDPTKASGYDQQQYDTGQAEAYDQQAHMYEQPGTAEYDQSQYAGEYEQGQGYAQGDPAYDQSQVYDQSGAAYEDQGYDQGQPYDQSNVQYDQGYDQTGGQYEQTGVYPETEVYQEQQGQVYTGAEEVYQPEGYEQTTTNQAYQDQSYQEQPQGT